MEQFSFNSAVQAIAAAGPAYCPETGVSKHAKKAWQWMEAHDYEVTVRANVHDPLTYMVYVNGKQVA